MKKMRKFKFLIASVLFCAMGYVGYIAHEKMTMSEAEKFMQANVEALTRDEGGTSTSWPCWSKQSASSDGYWRCGNPCKWIDGATGKGNEGRCYQN